MSNLTIASQNNVLRIGLSQNESASTAPGPNIEQTTNSSSTPVTETEHPSVSHKASKASVLSQALKKKDTSSQHSLSINIAHATTSQHSPKNSFDNASWFSSIDVIEARSETSQKSGKDAVPSVRRRLSFSNVITVDPAKVIKEIKNAATSVASSPFLDIAPTGDPDQLRVQLKDAYQKTFNEISKSFSEEIASSPGVGAAIKRNGHFYKYIMGNWSGLIGENPKGALKVFNELNNYLGWVRALPTADKRSQALESFFSLKENDELKCPEGTVERMQKMMAQMASSNPILTHAYAVSSNKYLGEASILASGLPVHTVAAFDRYTGVAPKGPTALDELIYKRVGQIAQAFTTDILPADVGGAIEAYLTGGFREMTDALEAHEREGTLSDEKVREFQKKYNEHLGMFFPEGENLAQGEKYFKWDEFFFRRLSFDREWMVLDVARKIFPVLTFESKIAIIEKNPDFKKTLKSPLEFFLHSPEDCRKFLSAYPKTSPKFGKYGDTLLHRFIDRDFIVCRLLAEKHIPIERMFVKNAKGFSPFDLMMEKGQLADVLMMNILCSSTKPHLPNQLKSALEKYDGDSSQLPGTTKLHWQEITECGPHAELIAACKKSDDPVKQMYLVFIALLSRSGCGSLVINNIEKFLAVDSAKLKEIYTSFDWSMPTDVVTRWNTFVGDNLDLLQRLTPRQISLTASSVKGSNESATFVKENRAYWFDLSEPVMEAYEKILNIPGGAKFVGDNLDSLQRLTPRQISLTASSIKGSNESARFVQANRAYWFDLSEPVMEAHEKILNSPGGAMFLTNHIGTIKTLNDAQKIETSKMHALTSKSKTHAEASKKRFIDVKFLTKNMESWGKLSSLKMSLLVKITDADTGKRPLTVRHFDKLEKLNDDQLRQTLQMVQVPGGRQVLKGNFKKWVSLSADEMKSKHERFMKGEQVFQSTSSKLKELLSIR